MVDLVEHTDQVQTRSDLISLKLKEKIKENPTRSFKEAIMSSDGKRLTFEFFTDTDESGSESRQYLRVGDQFFVSELLYKDLDKEKDASTKEIIIVPHPSALDDLRLVRYSALSIMAVNELPVDGKNVLDMGSADGLLSLLAYKKGAAKVTSIDYDPNWKHHMERLFLLNGIDPAHIHFISGDIRNVREIAGQLTDEYDVMYANLGPHYDMADLAAISTLRYLPRINAFVGGGYSQTPKLGPSMALDWLSEKGFYQKPKTFTAENPELPNMSFVIEK